MNRPVQRFVKRLLDLTIATFVLVWASPLLAVAAAVIKISDGGPIVYRRRVLGRGGREFDAFKLRTMRVDAGAWLADHPSLLGEYNADFKLKFDPRVTNVGRIIRRYSVDELPQMVNVIMGQMSIVGPRMLHPPELERFGRLGAQILSVKPGLTGLWQVSGRQDLTFQDRLSLDARYLADRDLWLDLRIMVKTIPVVVSGRGAY